MSEYNSVSRVGLLLIIVLIFSMENVKAQNDSTDNEIVFHIVKKRGCKKKVQETDLMRAGLRGAVKSAITEYFGNNFSNGVSSSVLISTSTDLYDTAGVMTGRSTDYNPNYKDRLTQTRRFDTSGNILSEEWRHTNKRQWENQEYIYDNARRISEIRAHGYSYTDGPRYKQRKKYYTWKAMFDTLGNYVEYETKAYKDIYKYDDKGNCIKKVTTENYKGHNSVFSYDYSYDESCRRSAAKPSMGSKREAIYKYNDKDSLIEMDEIYRGGSLVTTYDYNDNGDKIARKSVDQAGKIQKNDLYKYEYDDKGNWLKKEEYSFASQDGYYVRKITYY